MTKEDTQVVRELFELLQQTIDLLRQDMVSLRNDAMLMRVEHEGMKQRINSLVQDRSFKTKFWVAVIASIGSIAIAVLQTFRK